MQLRQYCLGVVMPRREPRIGRLNPEKLEGMMREEAGTRRLNLEPKKLVIEREELIKSKGKIKTGLQKLNKRAVAIALALSIVGTGLAHEPILRDETRLINTQKIELVSERPSAALQKRENILWTVKQWKETATEKPAQKKPLREDSPHTHETPTLDKILKAIKPKKPRI